MGFAMVMQIDYPILLGLMAFLLNYVPTIGSIIAAVPAVMLAVVQHGGSHGLYTALGYVLINVGISNWLEPKVLGRGLGLSPLIIVISMFFWGWVLGPVGMLLSVPLTMAIKIGLEAGPETRWIAVLMGATVLGGDNAAAAKAVPSPGPVEGQTSPDRKVPETTS